MFNVLRTLFAGASARAEEQLVDTFAIDLIEQKIREADAGLAAKGYWGMGIVLLMASLVNFVKYRMDARMQQDVVRQIEAARNEKILKEYVSTN